MKKFSWILIALCSMWFVSCNKDEKDGPSPNPDENTFTLMGGSIIVKNSSVIKVTSRNEYPEGISTEDAFNKRSLSRLRAKDASTGTGSVERTYGNDYRFKLIAEVPTFEVEGEEVQATHVKITPNADYAFVSYNTKSAPDKQDSHKGGVAVFKIILTGSGDNIGATTENIAFLKMPKAEISAIDYDANNKVLYAVGASEDPTFGYKEASKARFDYAFYMRIPLNANMTFNTTEENYHVGHLTSFQATSVKFSDGKLYITTGDGTNGTKGGLYILNTNDYSQVAFIQKEYARSVDVNEGNAYLMQSQNARINKYDLAGTGETSIYDVAGESKQEDAKSELLAWTGKQQAYIFAALNESGLRMISAADGTLIDYLPAPGNDPENEVTNSVSINSDKKKNSKGNEIQSNLLLLANGEKGIYWYEINEYNGTEQIILCNNNSFNFGEGSSANFVTSKGNIVFVATGRGGLNVLYIDFNPGTPPEPPITRECTDFMKWLYTGWDAAGLLPEGFSVFRTVSPQRPPHAVIQKLYADPNDVPYYIEVIDDVAVYISFIFDGAGFKNGFGYYVVPAGEDFNSFTSNIKDQLWERPAGFPNSKKIKDKHVIFKNVGAGLEEGATWQIKNYNGSANNDWRFKKGDRIVFFTVGNGWNPQNGWVNYIANGVSMPIFTNWKQNLADPQYKSDYGEYVDGKISPSGTYQIADYTWAKKFQGIQYNTFYSVDCNSVVMFFEDKCSDSDTDYNDLFISISTEKGGDMKLSKPKYYISTMAEQVSGEETVSVSGKTLYMGVNPEWVPQP